MKDVIIRSVFGLLFLMVVFTPFVYDLNTNANLLNLVFYLFAMLGVHEVFVMSAHKFNSKSMKAPALLLTTALFMPLLMQTATLFLPNLNNPFWGFLASIKTLIGLWVVFLVFVGLALYWTFKRDQISFMLSKPFIFSFFYPILPLWILSIAYTLTHGYDKSILLFVLVPIYLNDTLAYVFGRLFGKHKMAPSISPKKSWEGFVGGLLGTLVVVNLTLVILNLSSFTNHVSLSIVSILASVLATLGDLFESKLKRSIDIKDSGALLPGHGGILDRIDAMLFVAPVLYLILALI
jgi:phosphatidate cytidylyltransferase